MANPQRILLIKLRHHGDVLLATPVAHVLRHRFPQAEVDMLVYQETALILAGNPDIGKIWTLDRSLSGMRRLVAELHMLRDLHNRRYDWVIHLSDQWNGALIARLCAGEKSVGFDFPKRRRGGMIRWTNQFTQIARVAPSNSMHTVQQNLLALEPLGIVPEDEECECVLPIGKSDRDLVRNRLRERGVSIGYVVVHPASRWFFKCWEDERFAAVIDHLLGHGISVVVTCAPNLRERELTSAILAKVSRPGTVSLAGELTLNQLAALIGDCRLFVGVDSVPMHMAAALGRDTVALFGPSKLNEWRPWRTRSEVLSAADFGPSLDPDEVNTETTDRYLKNIPETAVIAAVDRMLTASPESNDR
jgi:heptosyltransferase III